MPAFRTLDEADVKGRRVLVRVDFNVPMQDGRVTDATRIERAATTLEELALREAKVVVLSHFGRPKGKPERSMSLAPLCKPLSEALGGADVRFAPDCVGDLTARGGRRAARRRGGAAREPALPRRREGRPGLRQPAGEPGLRPLRQRRLLGLPPGARLGYRLGRAPAGLRRPADAG